jgi:hypothetical protein
VQKARRRIMPKKTIDDVGRTDILIKNDIANRFFEKLGINPVTSYLMDVKKEIFKKYNLPEPVITIKNPKKTLAEQCPNNAYGICITKDEMLLFVKMFGLSGSDEYSEISRKIVSDVLGSY